MFEIRLFKPNADAEPRHGGAELLDAWRQSSDDVIWVDIAGPLSPTDQETLAAAFGLHRLALQDASRDRHPPKLEVFGDHSFLLFKGLSADSESIDCRTIQIAMFVGPRFLVTRHSDESPSIRRLSEEIDSRSSSIACSPGAFAARLARLMVDRYLGVLMALEPRLEEIEATVLSKGTDETLSELIGYKADLTRIRRFCHYHVTVARELHQSPAPGLDSDLHHELADVYEQWERAASLSDLYYQQASDLIDGYISVASHRLNQIMRILTIITAIFVPLSFLAGIYGMNFENMPELHSRFGYYTLLGIMVLVAGTLLITFRRKRWL